MIIISSQAILNSYLRNYLRIAMLVVQQQYKIVQIVATYIRITILTQLSDVRQVHWKART